MFGGLARDDGKHVGIPMLYGWIGMVVFFFARKQQRRLLLVASWCPGDVVGQGLVARLYSSSQCVHGSSSILCQVEVLSEGLL